MPRRVQVIGAHSADFVWRAGGAVAKAVQLGGTAEVVILRTAQEAWDLLKAGRGMPLYITESPTALHDFEEERFVAVRVELAYHEGHVDFASQAMQPYFIFWDAEGRVLGIPAVADAWATW